MRPRKGGAGIGRVRRSIASEAWLAYIPGHNDCGRTDPVASGKAIPMSAIQEMIAEQVKNNDVVLFMKGTPGFPQCGFSGQVVQILDYLGVDYQGINVLTSDELRQGIKEFSNWPTIPQLYVKGEFVGGCDIVREMFQAGELQSFLVEKGVSVKGAA